jgi:hypothetical protein
MSLNLHQMSGKPRAYTGTRIKAEFPDFSGGTQQTNVLLLTRDKCVISGYHRGLTSAEMGFRTVSK